MIDDPSFRKSGILVFTITCNEIADEIKAAAERGVRVRIISDGDQAESKGSDIESLSQVNGVQVRCDKDPDSHMHHKFAIIDQRVLLNGSFNWTRQAVLSNRENVVVSRNDGRLTVTFTDEFERLWKEFR